MGDDDTRDARLERQRRLDRYDTVAASLLELSDSAVRSLVDDASVLGSGIGGTSMLVPIAGAPVFVKCVSLTDRERRPENVRSTANLFDLPVWCQYGVGSPGFGVWREVAANAMTTAWVLAGRSDGFPLLYHWRVLDRPESAPALSDELADVERAVAYWHDAAAVRHRIEAIVESSAMVALFLEYLPGSLPEWLAGQVGGTQADAANAIAMVERDLRREVAFMNAAGLFHFDAHLGNIRTDGRRLYFVDLGLATSPRFALSASEADFLSRNDSHDACHTVTRLVDWLVTEVAGARYPIERDEYLRRCADGNVPVDLGPSAAEVVTRYAPIAVVVNEFYRKLHLEDRRTPYPVDQIRRACDRCGLPLLGSQDAGD